jgi:hypothetical protein
MPPSKQPCGHGWQYYHFPHRDVTDTSEFCCQCAKDRAFLHTAALKARIRELECQNNLMREALELGHTEEEHGT